MTDECTVYLFQWFVEMEQNVRLHSVCLVPFKMTGRVEGGRKGGRRLNLVNEGCFYKVATGRHGSLSGHKLLCSLEKSRNKDKEFSTQTQENVFFKFTIRLHSMKSYFGRLFHLCTTTFIVSL